MAREIEAIEPELIVAMGATAAQSLMGKSMPIGKSRGRALEWPDGRRGLVTVHPSFLLRIPDAASKAREYKAFVADLRLAAKLAAHPRGNAA
jgi:DNA polymerase